MFKATTFVVLIGLEICFHPRVTCTFAQCCESLLNYSVECSSLNTFVTLTPNGKELKKYKFYWYYVCGNKPLLCSCVGLILGYHSFLDFLALQISCSSDAFHNFKLTGRSAVFSMVVYACFYCGHSSLGFFILRVHVRFHGFILDSG